MRREAPFRWTAARVRHLKKRYGAVPAPTIARELGTTSVAVRVKASRLGLTTPHRRWSEEDDRFLRSHVCEWRWERLAEHFDCSLRAVRLRAWKIGIRAEDTRFELTASEVAEMVGVTTSAVCRWLRRGELKAWRTKPNAPKRIVPRALREYLLATKKGCLWPVPDGLLDLLARKVEVTEELSLEGCAELTRARPAEIQRWIDRKWLASIGQLEPVRAKDLKAFAINTPEHVPALRRVPVETVHLIADLWG